MYAHLIPPRRGLRHARNAGAQLAQLPYFCESDDVVCLDWVRATVGGIQQLSGGRSLYCLPLATSGSGLSPDL